MMTSDFSDFEDYYMNTDDDKLAGEKEAFNIEGMPMEEFLELLKTSPPGNFDIAISMSIGKSLEIAPNMTAHFVVEGKQEELSKALWNAMVGTFDAAGFKCFKVSHPMEEAGQGEPYKKPEAPKLH